MALITSLVLFINAAFPAAITLREHCLLPAHSTATSGSTLPPHSYMDFLFSEVRSQRNSGWRQMNARGGASIRGIVPEVVESDGLLALSFSTGKGFALNSLHQADLVLQSVSLATNATSASFNQTTSRFPLEEWRVESDQLNLFLILDLTLRLKRLETSQSDPYSFCVQFPRFETIERPILVLYNVERSDRSKKSVQRARWRTTGSGRKRALVSCQLHPFDVSLQEVNWSLQVLAPSHVRMNFCAGLCEISLTQQNRIYITNNSLIRGLIHIFNRMSQVPKPCCVPTRFSPETFMLFKNGEIVIESIHDIVATKCGCG